MIAAVAAGCGNSSPPTKAAYAASVVNARDRVDFALAEITQSKTKQEFLDQMVTSAGLIDDAAGDFDDGGSPTGFEDETEKLTKAFHQLAADLEGTAEQIQLPGYESLLDAKGLSFQSWVTANAVLTSLKKQGIDVEPLARH